MLPAPFGEIHRGRRRAGIRIKSRPPKGGCGVNRGMGCRKPYRTLSSARPLGQRDVLSSANIFFSAVILLCLVADSFAQTLYTLCEASISPHGLHKILLLFASTCDSGLRIGVLFPPPLYYALEEHSRICRFSLWIRTGKDVCTNVVVLIRCF